MPTTIPGLKIGPLDPDATESFGSVSAQQNARSLIRFHAQAHPLALIRALNRKRDDERTKGLDFDEVEEYVRGLRLENGDAVLPEKARLTGAAVRGERGRPQVLTFTYELDPEQGGSGRTGKWFASYDHDALPRSAESGDELVKVKEMRDRGIVAYDDGAAGRYFGEREIARLNRQVKSLRTQIEDPSAQVDGEASDGEPQNDVRPDVAVVAEAEHLRRTNQELLQRVAALEAALETRVQHPEARRDHDIAIDPNAVEPPFENYDDVKASDLAARLRSDEMTEEERRAVLEYERAHQNRRTVMAAAESSLGSGNSED